VIVLGVVLLVIGFVCAIDILWKVGVALLLIGVVLYVLGGVGHPVAGRRYWY
jgi:hypothetical protein